MILKKAIAHFKWFFSIIPVGILGAITAPIIYPIAYLIEKVLPNNNPLWWWLDDEIEDKTTNSDWLIYCNNNVNNFKYLYIWHAFRNTIWNLKNLLKPESARVNCVSNTEEFIEIKQDNLWRDNVKVSIHGKCIEMACYKWIDKNGNEGWQVNRGIKVSKKFSTIGVSELWYKANNVLYYRYSIAKEVTFLGNIYYFEFRMGTSEKRHLLIFKFKKK